MPPESARAGKEEAPLGGQASWVPSGKRNPIAGTPARTQSCLLYDGWDAFACTTERFDPFHRVRHQLKFAAEFHAGFPTAHSHGERKGTIVKRTAGCPELQKKRNPTGKAALLDQRLGGTLPSSPRLGFPDADLVLSQEARPEVPRSGFFVSVNQKTGAVPIRG